MINCPVPPQRHSRRPSKRFRRGATTVEFALTLPIAFMLFFGAIEMTRLNSVRNTIDNAAYEGARRAILPGATQAKVEAAANAILDAGSIQRATITMDPSSVTTATERVTVTVEVEMNRNSWVAPVYSKDLTLTRTCTLTREEALANADFSQPSSGNGNGNGGNGNGGNGNGGNGNGGNGNGGNGNGGNGKGGNGKGGNGKGGNGKGKRP